MAVYDRWHTRKPRTDRETGESVEPCTHSSKGQSLYPSLDHGKGDRWQVRWRDPDGNQCKRNFEKKAGKNPNVHAEAWDKKIQGELATGAYVDPTAGEIQLRDFARSWRESLTGKDSRLEVIDRHLAHICDFEHSERGDRRIYQGESIIARRSMHELARRPDLVQRWVKSLEERGLSAQTIRHITQTLSSIFLAAIEAGTISRNPVQSRTVQPPTVVKRPIEPWTIEQVRAAATQMDSALPELGAGAGLRNGELCGFAVEDIRDGYIAVRRQVMLIRGTLCFRLPKRDKVRDVPLGEVLATRLEAHMEAHPPLKVELPWEEPDGDPVTAELLFYRPRRLPHYRQTLNLAWGPARAAAGAPPTEENGPHVLRHTFAAACLSEGVDVVTLASWLGHENPAFTLRVYGHMVPSAATKGRAAIDKFFGNGNP